MKKTVELGGELYEVEYTNSSYLKLKKDYDFDFRQEDFNRLADAENPDFATIFKFLLLGLVKHHGDEDLMETLDNIPMSRLQNAELIETFGEAWREAHEVETNEEKEEVGKEKDK